MDMFEAQILAQNLLGGADNYPLLAVPFFLLAGEIMNEGGLSKRIVEFAMALVGHIRGGLGYVTIVASILLSALSGSAVADAAALTDDAAADDGGRRPRAASCCRADRRIRRDRAGAAAVDRPDHLRRHGQRVDFQAVHGRHRARPADGRLAGG